MSPLFTNVLQQAMRLDERERAALAAELIDSLDQNVDENAEAEWEAEIARRVADMDAGKAKMIPWAQVRQRLMRRIDEASAA